MWGRMRSECCWLVAVLVWWHRPGGVVRGASLLLKQPSPSLWCDHSCVSQAAWLVAGRVTSTPTHRPVACPCSLVLQVSDVDGLLAKMPNLGLLVISRQPAGHGFGPYIRCTQRE